MACAPAHYDQILRCTFTEEMSEKFILHRRTVKGPDETAQKYRLISQFVIFSYIRSLLLERPPVLRAYIDTTSIITV